MITIVDALNILTPNAEWTVDFEKNIVLEWLDKIQTQPSEEQIQEKLTELQNAEPMRLLRQERDRKLTETDWWCATDRTPTQAQLDYRTALRDLPSTASPSLDENGNLTGVEWPTKPE